MEHLHLTIPKYRWEVFCYIAANEIDKPEVIGRLWLIGAPLCHIYKVRKKFENEDNHCMTYSNNENRVTVMLISKADSPKEFFNSYTSESRQLTQHIADAHGIDASADEGTNIASEIATAFYPCVRRYIGGN